MQAAVVEIDNRELLEAIDILDREIFEHANWGIEDLTANMDNSYDSVISITAADGTLCGYAILRVLGEAEILRIGVAAEQRRKGYAGLLMRKMLEVSEKNAADRMLLEVRAGNIPAIALYRSFGFKEIALRRDYYSMPTEDALIMEAMIERID